MKNLSESLFPADRYAEPVPKDPYSPFADSDHGLLKSGNMVRSLTVEAEASSEADCSMDGDMELTTDIDSISSAGYLPRST